MYVTWERWRLVLHHYIFLVLFTLDYDDSQNYRWHKICHRKKQVKPLKMIFNVFYFITRFYIPKNFELYVIIYLLI